MTPLFTPLINGFLFSGGGGCRHISWRGTPEMFVANVAGLSARFRFVSGGSRSPGVAATSARLRDPLSYAPRSAGVRTEQTRRRCCRSTLLTHTRIDGSGADRAESVGLIPQTLDEFVLRLRRFVFLVRPVQIDTELAHHRSRGRLLADKATYRLSANARE